MKRLFIGVGALFIICGLFVLNKNVKNNRDESTVSLVEVEIKTVNETASCKGYLSAANSKYHKSGCPAEIVYIPVSEGEYVSKGDLLFVCRPLGTDELKAYLGDIISGEIQNSAEKLSDDLSEADILSAAAYYAEYGKIPPWFSGYYLPDSAAEKENNEGKQYVYAEFDGKISEIAVSEGDTVSGILGAVLVTDETSLIAEVGIPEQYISLVEIGQYANLSVSSYSGQQFSARVTDISDSARTSGSILGSEETVVDCTLSVDPVNGKLIPGLSVRADIFVNTWKNTAVVPYSALCSDENGEYVWLYENGAVSRVDIDPQYRYTKGVVVEGVFKGGEQLVKDPGEMLYNGMVVSVSTEER